MVVGLAYIVVGAFFVALPWLVSSLAAGTNDGRPVLPEAVASALGTIWVWTAGQLNAVGTIGAGILIAGIAALVGWWRGRAVAARRAAIADPTPDPVLP